MMKPRPAKEIVSETVGRRYKITSMEMESILRAIHREYGKDSLANSYVPRSFDEASAKPWLPWMAMLHGITVVSFGLAQRDGWMRYDQPGSMYPGQKARVSFVRAGGVGADTIAYLRRHCDRLLVVADDEQEVFLPPDVQRRLFAANHRGPYRMSAADAAALEMLREERNECCESQHIDDRMLKLVVGDVHVPRVYRLACDNGHTWERAEGDREGENCPQCGELFV